MKITTIGRGTIGGTLARLWRSAGHEVTELGRDGGDASDADVVLVAVPYGVAVEALQHVSGIKRKIVLDATNPLRGEDPPAGHASNAEYIKAQTGGPTAKAFNLNLGVLLDQAATAAHRPSNLWTGDDDTRAIVEELSQDIGMEARHAGPIAAAPSQEALAAMLVAIVRDTGSPVFYRFAPPQEL